MPDRLDLALVEKDLARDSGEPAGTMQWLHGSHKAPDNFWSALLSANDGLFSWPGKSTLYRKYDFYHDIVARNRQNPAPAFQWFEDNVGWRETGYRQLGRLAAETAAGWTDRGVSAGGKLCLVSRLDERFLASFLAALKIGLIVCLLPPGGRSFLRRRIDAVEPDWIWSEEEYLPLISQYRSKILPSRAPAGRGEDDSRSHAYDGGTTFGVCFDPSSAQPHVPRELATDAAYLCAVRDGMIALGLRPGQGLAAPGLPMLETQPALLLACLLNGATFVHLEEHHVARKPELLLHRSLRAVGVTRNLREILLQTPVEVGKAWDFWFRDPAESQDLEAWREFSDLLGLSEVFSGNLRWNASLGGGILFSLKRKGSPHPNVLPGAGVPWNLADPADPERESLWGHGLFSVKPPGTDLKAGIVAGGILAHRRKEWGFVRPVLSWHSGRCYPVSEVLENLIEMPFGPSCSVAEVPAAGADDASSFVLLVFAGGRKVDEAQLTEQIRRRIIRELGKEFLPDRIQVVDLHPRRGEDGSIDHAWCTREYLSGGLQRRSKGEVTRCLTELRDLIHFS